MRMYIRIQISQIINLNIPRQPLFIYTHTHTHTHHFLESESFVSRTNDLIF